MKLAMADATMPATGDGQTIFGAISYAREALHEAFECVVGKRKGFVHDYDYTGLVDELWGLCKQLDGVYIAPPMKDERQAN